MMENTVKWCLYEDHKYLHIDFSCLTDLEIFNSMYFAKKIFKSCEMNSVYVLADFTNVDLSFSTNLTMIKEAKELQRFVKKSAVIGISETYSSIFNIYVSVVNSRVKSFLSKEEAFQYLFS